MNKALVGRLFLLVTLALAAFGRVGAAPKDDPADPTCPNDNEQTCEDLDNGCHSKNVHYFCLWRAGIAHCNCTLVLPEGY